MVTFTHFVEYNVDFKYNNEEVTGMFRGAERSALLSNVLRAVGVSPGEFGLFMYKLTAPRPFNEISKQRPWKVLCDTYPIFAKELEFILQGPEEEKIKSLALLFDTEDEYLGNRFIVGPVTDAKLVDYLISHFFEPTYPYEYNSIKWKQVFGDKLINDFGKSHNFYNIINLNTDTFIDVFNLMYYMHRVGYLSNTSVDLIVDNTLSGKTGHYPFAEDSMATTILKHYVNNK
jgi:hypothetical protein